ncbi:metal-dependent transcriptional regulator [Candidatus Stoquefichus sp. SB1]|jgi:Mn-dependent DtxR family transcriptional regulator|uniref:metal-dependent transcriptional regulator n=1 Tax=Candidatus Stoquefichus sp. SB1 TaxID=1658109 RepID=UPI00067EA968|nr:metal-dependent transcriptional regulator [Candidatus Stoquefichus sp. SB1]
MDLHESGEMYLETILMLKHKNQYVRSIDIAHEMNFSKPSVSRAIKLLKESKLIEVDKKGYIEFTDEGRKIAEKVYNRHTTLTNFFISLGVSDAQAEDDACRLEHIISEESYQCIQNYLTKQS